MLMKYLLAFVVLFSTKFVIQSHAKVISTPTQLDYVLQATRKWLKNAQPFRNCSSDEEFSKAINGLLNWKTPEYIVKNFPYYLSGLSDDELPIYIAECGKYDAVAILHQGSEVVDNIERAVAQIVVRGLKTVESGGIDGTNHKVYMILDFEGHTYAHFASIAAIELLTRLALQYIPMAEYFIEKVYLINGNYAVDSLYNAYRPILGHLTERVEIYGPKKAKWQAVLRREFPLDSLPPWYGGTANFTPIAAYG